MSNTHNSKHPIISSIFIALVPVVLLSFAGAAISIGAIDTPQSYVVQSVACVLAILVGLLITRKTGLSFKQVGFCNPALGTAKTVLYYIPIVVIILLNFVVGFSDQNNAVAIAILLVFTITVGINEELFFRGIILQRMKKIGIHKAIFISAILFGLLHAANLLGGYKEPLYVALQIGYAFAFGFVAAELVVITKSLLSVILWHFAHDFTTLITNQALTGTAMVVLGIQVVILIVFAFVLWRETGKIPIYETE